MSVRPVVRWPNPILSAKTVQIAALDDNLRSLLQDLVDTMTSQRALGLAAPQIGVPLAVCVINVGFAIPGHEPLILVNPNITWASAAIEKSSEGCLSAPGLYLEIPRSEQIKFQTRDANWNLIEAEAKGFMAKAIQHGVDHLNGKMFWDRLSLLKRDMVVRKLAKARR